MALIHLLTKKTAKKVVEYCCVAFFQAMILVLIFPEFRSPFAALIVTVSLVTGLVVAFEFFWKPPEESDE